MSDPFVEIFSKYKSPIYNYFYRSTLNVHIAEDLTQDTFLKAFKAITSFRGESNINTWLFKIARNNYLNYISKKQVQLEDQFDPTEIHFEDQIDEYKATNERIIIHKILYQLPERYRTLIILRDQNNLTYQEISKVLGENEGQVKIGLYRARKRFKELYIQELKEDYQ